MRIGNGRLWWVLLGFCATACSGSKLGNVESKRKVQEEDRVVKGAFDAAQRAACGEGGVTLAGEAAFLRQPYLQKVTENSAHILWTTAATEDLLVTVTTPDGDLVFEGLAQVDERPNRGAFDQFDTRIDGLEPGQLYCYTIRSGTGEWLLPTGFRTAPAADDGSPIRIAVIGDLGTRTTDQFMVRDELMNVPFDLVLVAGDLAYERGTLIEHEQNFFEVYRELMRTVPFFVISGNHDYAADGAVFREVFSLFENGGPDGVERWYSFDWGPIHLVALDTEVIGPVQAAWLEADLAGTEQPWRIVYMHRPAYSSGKHGSTRAVQEQFVPGFERYGVDLVLSGHDHNFERTVPLSNVTYAVVGSSGRGSSPVGTSDFTAYSESVAHFGHITIDGGALRLNAIDAVGNDFDTVTLEP